jgi:hypothetical protein
MSNSEKGNVASFGLKQIRRVVIFVIGMSVLLFGVVLLVMPGPAVVVIPAGLAILAIEFRWARNWLRRAKVMVKGAGARMGQGKTPRQLWRDWRARRAQRKLARQARASAGRSDLESPPVDDPEEQDASRGPLER